MARRSPDQLTRTPRVDALALAVAGAGLTDLQILVIAQMMEGKSAAQIAGLLRSAVPPEAERAGILAQVLTVGEPEEHAFNVGAVLLPAVGFASMRPDYGQLAAARKAINAAVGSILTHAALPTNIQHPKVRESDKAAGPAVLAEALSAVSVVDMFASLALDPASIGDGFTGPVPNNRAGGTRPMYFGAPAPAISESPIQTPATATDSGLIDVLRDAIGR